MTATLAPPPAAPPLTPRDAARAAVGVTGGSDVVAWSTAITAPAKRRLLGLTLTNASVTLTATTFALLLPSVAAERGWSSGSLGAAVVLGLAAAALAALPLSSQIPLRRRSRAVTLFAFNAAVLGLFMAMLPPILVLAVFSIARGLMLAFLLALVRPLAFDAAVPEVRGRAIIRVLSGLLVGIAIGALFALLATSGPALGSGQALVLASVVGIVLSLGSTVIPDTQLGGVEPARLNHVMGRVDDPLSGLRPRWRDSYARISRIPTVRRSLSAYVGVGWASAVFLVVPLISLSNSKDNDAAAVPTSVAIGAVVAIIVLALIGRGVEKSRRTSPEKAASVVKLGLAIGAVGIVLLALVPATYAPQFALAFIGSFLAWACLDLTTMSVVQPEDRGALSGLTSFSIIFGGLLSLTVVTIIHTIGGSDSSITAGLIITAIPIFVLMRSVGRIVRSASDDLDQRLGVDAYSVDAFEAGEVDETGATIHSDDSHTGTAMSARNISFSYGSVQVLFDVNLRIGEGEMVALLGPNGVGKTTTLRVLSGLERPQKGSIRLGGIDVTTVPPARRVGMGVSQIVGGNAVFGSMTVAENLQTYGFSMGRDRKAVSAGVEKAFETFPRLSDRRNQLGSTLSGGEQQMLGLSKALICKPQVLIVDEFSLGLAPIIVGELLEMVRALNAEGVAILIVEQSVNVALNLVDRCYFMEKGRIVYEGRSADLLAQPELVQALSLGGHPS